MPQDGNLNPDQRQLFNERNKTRYPSPFFDISQQYMPPTMKELFKWVYFYVTNNSFLGPALNKIARYPITDLMFEDKNHDLIEKWQNILNTKLQIKTFLMEANMDNCSYGNAFITIHYPFTRFIVCRSCNEQYGWRQIEKKIVELKIKIKCKKCGSEGDGKIRDVPYRSLDSLRLVRINPEFIDIKYNDATGRHTYLYSIPDRLKRQIMSGDPDILEDTPLLYIESIKQKKKIKLSSQNLFHWKRPTLAGKDMGWGLPLIAPALKDLFHFYTLRRAQEAISQEHIVPFDLIFPQANGKFDPYVHSDLASWKRELESQLAKRRRDPNYKAVLPFPVGYERIGGDGKNLMLTPEMDFLAKTIIGSCGIPQEFVFGGSMQWSGSSVSLRTLENEFLHHRSQALLLVIWIVDRLKTYLGMASPKSIKFTDFKMADDQAKMQMMMNAATQEQISWEGVIKEMGKDPEVEREKILREKEFLMKLREKEAIAQADAQGKAAAVSMRYQREAMEEENAFQAQQAPPPTNAQLTPENDAARNQMAQVMAQKLLGKPEPEQQAAIQRLAQKDPEFAKRVEDFLTQLQGRQQEQSMQVPAGPQLQQAAEQVTVDMRQKQPAGGKADTRPKPEQKPPRRANGI